jgi:hypothetical protein
MLFPRVSYLVWIRIPFFLVADEFDMSNSFTNFLGLFYVWSTDLFCSTAAFLRLPTITQLFYWTRTLIAICCTMWNILYHTVLPYCRELMVPQICPPTTAPVGPTVMQWPCARVASAMFCCVNTIFLYVLLLHLAQCDTEVDVLTTALHSCLCTCYVTNSRSQAPTVGGPECLYDNVLLFSSSSPILELYPSRAVLECLFLISPAMV